jgi:hypothetical protein
MEQDSLYDVLRGLMGGAGVTLIAASVGRLMFHSAEVKKKRRKFFGPELFWELPTALGMGFIGEGLSSYYNLDELATVAVIVTLSYLGPRGVEAIYQRFSKGSAMSRPSMPSIPTHDGPPPDEK